jgi:hypothetical protein
MSTDAINIYCDESRHTSDPADAYMVIGGVACPRNAKREIVHHIHMLKKKYNTQGEFGWKRLSPNRRDFYWAVLDFFARESQLAFRCIVVQEKYVVVLQARDKINDMDFVTAFIADTGYINKIKREGGWVETKKSPSLNGD